MNPRNLRTLVTFVSWCQFFTFSTFLSSICTVPWSTVTLRNSICSCSNVHFLGLRKRLCSCNFARTRQMFVQCHSRCYCSISLVCLQVCMAMSSIYTVSHYSTISKANIVFIIVWNVAGELVRPKNITISSKSPLFIRKAAFHWSPSLIRMLL